MPVACSEGGVADSMTVLICFGILLGACKPAFSISDLVWTFGAGAVRGGSGGGDGATMSVAIICVGSASGCKRGQAIKAIIPVPFTNKEMNGQYLLRAGCVLPDSMKIVQTWSRLDKLEKELTYTYLDTKRESLIPLTR